MVTYEPSPYHLLDVHHVNQFFGRLNTYFVHLGGVKCSQSCLGSQRLIWIHESNPVNSHGLVLSKSTSIRSCWVRLTLVVDVVGDLYTS